MGAEINGAIGLRIREQRENSGYTREKLAEKAEMGCSSLAAIELGKRTASVESLMKLCRALNVSADYLLFGDNVERASERIAAALRNLDPKQIRYAEEIMDIYAKSVRLTLRTMKDTKE